MMAFWTPADITTALWLDAADSSTLFDAVSGGGLVAADGAVARWEDKSGNSRHVTQTIVSERPANRANAFEGLPTIHFGSNGTKTALASEAFNWPRPFSIFATARQTGGSSYRRILNIGFGSDTNGFFGSLDSNFATFFGSGSVWVDVNVNTPLQSVLSPCLLSVTNSGSGSLDAIPYVNGVSQNAKGGGSFSGTGRGVRIGELAGSSQFWVGYISEVLVVPFAVSQSERQRIEGYLAHKWGLTASLPSDHPYKSAAPTQSIYAVNGKTPIAAWIPTRSQSADDLVGSNNGTLTNGAAIVASTGAGGSHAIQTDFVGNKHVVIASAPEISTLQAADFSLSAWANSSGVGNNQTIFSSASAGNGWFVRRNRNVSANSLSFTGYFGSTNAQFTSNNNAFVGNQWVHVTVVFFAATKTAKLYINGAETTGYSESTAGAGSAVSDAAQTKMIGRLGANGQEFIGLLDDLRLWDQALNATDIADLYASGLGRGITFGGTIQTRRRRQLGGYGL